MGLFPSSFESFVHDASYTLLLCLTLFSGPLTEFFLEYYEEGETTVFEYAHTLWLKLRAFVIVRNTIGVYLGSYCRRSGFQRIVDSCFYQLWLFIKKLHSIRFFYIRRR
jgi:hypothetical protein